MTCLWDLWKLWMKMDKCVSKWAKISALEHRLSSWILNTLGRHIFYTKHFIFPRYVLAKFSLSLLLFTCATEKCHVNSSAAPVIQQPASSKTILSVHHAQWYQLITEHRKWSACCLYHMTRGFVINNRINYTFIFHVNAFRARTLLI